MLSFYVSNPRTKSLRTVQYYRFNFGLSLETECTPLVSFPFLIYLERKEPTYGHVTAGYPWGNSP